MPNSKNVFGKIGFQFRQRPQKWPKTFIFCLSGKISPNIVTQRIPSSLFLDWEDSVQVRYSVTGRDDLRDGVIEWDEGTRDDCDVHKVPEIAQIGSRMKHKADVNHLKHAS